MNRVIEFARTVMAKSSRHAIFARTADKIPKPPSPSAAAARFSLLPPSAIAPARFEHSATYTVAPVQLDEDLEGTA